MTDEGQIDTKVEESACDLIAAQFRNLLGETQKNHENLSWQSVLTADIRTWDLLNTSYRYANHKKYVGAVNASDW